jgi:hypothetical protein
VTARGVGALQTKAIAIVNVARVIVRPVSHYFVIAVWSAKEAQSAAVKTLIKIPIQSFVVALMLGFAAQA